MATIDANIRTYLLGKMPTAKFYASRIPQDATYPNVTYHLISTVPTRGLEGYAGLTQCRFQFDCWGEYAECVTFAEALRNYLDDYDGAMGTMTEVYALRVNQFTADPSWNDDGTDNVHQRIICEYMVYFNEAQPTG